MITGIMTSIEVYRAYIFFCFLDLVIEDNEKAQV